MSTNKTEMQNQLQKLLAEVNTLKQLLESIPDEKVVWEPKGGLFYIHPRGYVEEMASEDKCRNFGVEYQTRELAEQALEAMRTHNRLLAYKAEFCPEYAPDWSSDREDKYYIYLDNTSGKYNTSNNMRQQSVSAVYFPKDIAITLKDKLNSGVVVL